MERNFAFGWKEMCLWMDINFALLWKEMCIWMETNFDLGWKEMCLWMERNFALLWKEMCNLIYESKRGVYLFVCPGLGKKCAILDIKANVVSVCLSRS
jgi:hypothetical protein